MANPSKPRDEFVEVNDLKLHYREWGDSRSRHALLMLHGYASTSEMWTDVATDLAREFRVIALDMRGYGQSDRAEDMDYTRATQLEDLEAFVDAVGLRSLTLVGHSMGGALAICYAAEHPEVVTALVVVEAAPEVLRSGIEGVRRLLLTGDGFDSVDAAVEAFRAYQPYASTEQLERRVHSVLKMNEDGRLVWDFDEAFRDPQIRPPEPDPGQRRLSDLWDSADRVQCPTMIIRGQDTDMLTPEAIQRLHRRIAGSRVSLIEDAGHHVPTDQPASLALNIREFLQSIAAI
ncbi:MAG: alpha/beta hydrolase [Dehalococcoidia bacterium]|nr:alpha/beta hydrolase [Dehalococcoidia bacterium]MCB9483416.1 alpha/beta hydrolase [Dehalococcoidia bacterium]MCB9491579.1 alpha/beta hydrolase [Dehalococcoidia bacterium]